MTSGPTETLDTVSKAVLTTLGYDNATSPGNVSTESMERPWDLKERGTALIVVETFFFALAGTVAVVGNCLVVSAVIKVKTLWSIPNALVANLAVTDILMAVLNISLATVVLATGRWPFSNALCQASAFLNFTMGFGSLLTMTLIALNRYVGVCKPARYNHLFTMKKTCCYVVLVWILASLSAMMPLVGWGAYSFETGKAICLLRWSSSPGFVLFFMTLTIFLPIVVLLFCYITIFWTLRQSRIRLLADGNTSIDRGCAPGPANPRPLPMQTLEVPGERTRGERTLSQKLKLHKDEVRLVTVVFVVFVAFAVCWLPVCLINMYEAFVPYDYTIPRWMDLWTIFLVYVSSTCNPFIYGLLNKNYKKAFKTILCRGGGSGRIHPFQQPVEKPGTSSST